MGDKRSKFAKVAWSNYLLKKVVRHGVINLTQFYFLKFSFETNYFVK